jgi:hypothetical protein
MSPLRYPQPPIMSPEDQHFKDHGGTEALPSLVRLVAERAADSFGHRAKICVLLGAGADISSGGLTFVELKRQAVEEYTKRPLFDITLPEQIEARFEELFVRLQPDERALLVDWLFHRMKPLQPSDAYKLLVLLAEVGGVDAVVTTNFDLMLETAQSQMGRDTFQVFAPGVARPYMWSPRFELPKKPYLKLHGDISSRSLTLLTSADLENAKYEPSMLELLRSILSTHDLVLIGYSGFDRALAPIIADAVSAANNRIFWCNPHSPSSESPLYSKIADRVRVIRLGFDQLMMEVARPVLERPSLATTEPRILSVQEETITDLVKNEVLKPYRDSVESPRDYQFNRSYIEGFKCQFTNLRNLISKRAAAKTLGKHSLHHKWLKMGCLKYDVSKDGKRRFLNKVKVEEIASFMETVVTRAEAARLLEMHVNSIGYWIRKGLFKPVIHPYRRAFRSPLYLRAEVTKFKAIRGSA